MVPVINHGLSGNSLVEVFNIEENKNEYIFLNDTNSDDIKKKYVLPDKKTKMPFLSELLEKFH